MALFRPSAIVQNISGAVGGVVFVNGRGGPYVSTRGIKREAVTRRQQLARNGLQRAIVRWSEITDAQRLAWSLLAARTPRIDRLGRTTVYTGRQLFLRHNGFNGRLTLAMQDDPPSLGVSIAFERCTVTVVSGVFTLRCFRQGGTGSGRAAVYGARSHSTAAAPSNYFAQFFNFTFSTNAVVNPTTAFSFVFGAPQLGEYVKLRVATRFDNCLWSDGVVCTTKAV